MRLIDITMGKKRSVKPNGVQVVIGKGNGWEIGKQVLYNEFGAIMLRLVAPQECVGIYRVGVS